MQLPKIKYNAFSIYIWFAASALKTHLVIRYVYMSVVGLDGLELKFAQKFIASHE